MLQDTKHISVLLVEPHFSDAVALQKRIIACSGQSAQFIMTKNVMEACGKLRNMEIDIILFDLDAVYVNLTHSFQMLFQNKQPDTPIIVLSEIHQKDAAMEAIFKGASDYLIKGRDNNLLSKVICYHYSQVLERNSNRYARSRLG